MSRQFIEMPKKLTRFIWREFAAFASAPTKMLWVALFSYSYNIITIISQGKS
jgi:hypothetical protein